MIAMKVRLEGAKELERAIQKLGNRMADKVEAATRSGALIIRNSASVKAPKRTGNLRRSIHIETQKKTRTICVVLVGTNLVYAAQKEFGGWIYPRQAQMLHFFTYGGVEVFTHQVYQAPKPYLRPAFDENRSRCQEEIGRALAQVIRQAGSRE